MVAEQMQGSGTGDTPYLYAVGRTSATATCDNRRIKSVSGDNISTTTNPIESTFATIRLRHRRTKGSGSRRTAFWLPRHAFLLAHRSAAFLACLSWQNPPQGNGDDSEATNSSLTSFNNTPSSTELSRNTPPDLRFSEHNN